MVTLSHRLLPRLRSRRGQFLPLTAFVLVTGVIFLEAVVDVYRVSKAKLEAQNLADASALAVAALQARCINAVMDRDEWLNHMYAPDSSGKVVKNKHQLPNISDANGTNLNADQAKNYATLVATINRAQLMFAQAYNNFLGTGGQTSSMNAGVGSLADILSEIGGLSDPGVSVFFFNTSADDGAVQGQMQQQSAQPNASAQGGTNFHGSLKPLVFKTEDITIYNTDDKKNETLNSLFYQGQTPDPILKVGWMHPDWSQNTMHITSPGKSGTTQDTIGTGVYVTKAVSLLLLPAVTVKAKSIAYVLKASGVASREDAGLPPSKGPNGEDLPPPSFRPTYYIQLAGH